MHALPYPDEAPAPELVARLGGRPGVCWLDGDGRSARGRYSFVGSDPVAVVARHPGEGDPLPALDALGPAPGEPVRDGDRDAPDPGQMPAWVGYVAYDALFEREGLPQRLSAARAKAPVLRFQRHDALWVRDHLRERSWLVGDDRAACERLALRLGAPGARIGRAQAGPVEATATARHLRAIERALGHIGAGDIYQVNLARRFRAPLSGDPLQLYLALRAQGPVPLGMWLSTPGRAIASRSMERFLRLDRASGEVWTAPIKGTIARRGDRDAAEAASLRADPKEQAEHAMIVDLMRNDLGRVAEIGSVRVASLMQVEAYAGLSHLVSEVRCRARPDLTPATLLAATFPPGSVTGTPKRRALEIIEALEETPRGVYTGALGFVDRRGGCSFAVGIRSAIVEDGYASYHAGGGIVEASDPGRELRETELKAASFLSALAALRADDAGAHPPAP